MVENPEIEQVVEVNEGAYIGYSSAATAIISFTSKPAPAPNVAADEKSSDKVAAWGAANDFPQVIEKEIKKNPDLGSVLDWQARALYAGGLTYKVMQEDKEGNAVYLDKVIPEIETWLKRNFQYRTHAPHHFYKFYNVFPELTLSLDKKYINFLTAKKPSHARYSIQNPDTKQIEWLYLHSKWEDSPSVDAEDMVKIPVIDPMVYTPELLKLRTDSLNFIYPISYPSDNTYYALANWDSIRQSKWLELANSIPAFKIALMKNQITVKYHIQMPDYWMSWKYPDFETIQKRDPKKAKELIDKEKKNFEDFLTGPENAGKSITSVFKTDAHGKAFQGWTITPIGDKIAQGAYLEDSQEATIKIFSSVGVDPALAGIIPGKSGANRNGSDKREALNIYLSLCQLHEDLILQPYDFIAEYNGWNKKYGQIVWSFIKPYMQTLNQVTPSKRENTYAEDLNSTDQVKEHLPVNTGLDFKSIRPFLLRAFGSTVLQLITRGEYESMVTLTSSEPGEEAGEQEKARYELNSQLRYYVEAATVNLAYLLYIPHGQVSIDDGGMTIPGGDHKKQAYKWQIEALKQSYIDSGYESLEEMLRLLDGNRLTFTSWAASDAAKDYKKLFISSTEEFEKYQNLNGSRLLFRSLAANLNQVELMRTRKLMPAALYQELKNYAITGQADPQQLALLGELLPLVKGHLANRALEIGILRRSVVLSETGVLRMNIKTEEKAGEAALPATLQALQDQYAATAAEYEFLISELLTQNEPEQEIAPLYDNTQESKLFHL